MQELNNTQYFKVEAEKDLDVRDVIAAVYSALTEKGYNPVNQIVGVSDVGRPDLYYQSQRCKKFDYARRA